MPSWVSTTTPRIPCLPAQLGLTAMLGSQNAPRPDCWTMGNSCVQFPPAFWSRLARYSQFPWGWPRKVATGSPPTWKSVTFLEKSGVKPPQGAMPSLSSSKPMDGGAFRLKWASAVESSASVVAREIDESMMG